MDAGDPRFEAPTVRSRRERRASAAPFAFLTAFLAIAALVEATPERATLLGFEGPDCPAALLSGSVGCPGCGLTRATALLLDGELAAAGAVHAAAWLVVVLAAAGAAIHGLVLLTGRRPRWMGSARVAGRVTLAAGLLLAWLARLV